MEQELNDIGSQILSWIGNLITWFFSLTEQGMIGVFVVGIVIIFIISLIAGIVKLFFYRWYMRGILHGKTSDEFRNINDGK